MKKSRIAETPMRFHLLVGLSLLFSAATLLPPLSSIAAETENRQELNPISNPSPGADLWRAVRRSSTQGTSQIKNVDSGVLVNDSGLRWQEFRMTQLIPYSAYLMAGILAAILLFFLIRGRIRLEEGESGKTVPRSSTMVRIAHWFTVILFMILAVTGLILLYGRAVLIPILGQETFSVIAAASKEAHNLFGPIFPVALIIIFIPLVKVNIYEKGDLKWLFKGGGFFGGHVSAGLYNMGEKTWFWIVILVGLTISVSGLILDFSVFGQSREVMELSHIVHTIAAILIISVAFGHIYLATVGVEGTLQAMTSGEVDANWAKSHHDRWHDELELAEDSESKSSNS